MFADYLRSLGFTPARYDRDVWMGLRDSKDGYDYGCTQVDDFKIVARDPNQGIKQISNAFLVKSHGPRSYYLGANYVYHESQDIWTYGAKT